MRSKLPNYNQHIRHICDKIVHGNRERQPVTWLNVQETKREPDAGTTVLDRKVPPIFHPRITNLVRPYAVLKEDIVLR